MAHTTNTGARQHSAIAGTIKSLGERPRSFPASLLIGFIVLANPFVKVPSQIIRPVPDRGSRGFLDQGAKLEMLTNTCIRPHLRGSYPRFGAPEAAGGSLAEDSTAGALRTDPRSPQEAGRRKMVADEAEW